jgi:hypothetical protein
VHLASLDQAEAFVTFDANFRKRAAPVTRVPIL